MGCGCATVSQWMFTSGWTLSILSSVALPTWLLPSSRTCFPKWYLWTTFITRSRLSSRSLTKKESILILLVCVGSWWISILSKILHYSRLWAILQQLWTCFIHQKRSNKREKCSQALKFGRSRGKISRGLRGLKCIRGDFRCKGILNYLNNTTCSRNRSELILIYQYFLLRWAF